MQREAERESRGKRCISAYLPRVRVVLRPSVKSITMPIWGIYPTYLRYCYGWICIVDCRYLLQPRCESLHVRIFACRYQVSRSAGQGISRGSGQQQGKSSSSSGEIVRNLWAVGGVCGGAVYVAVGGGCAVGVVVCDGVGTLLTLWKWKSELCFCVFLFVGVPCLYFLLPLRCRYARNSGVERRFV